MIENFIDNLIKFFFFFLPTSTFFFFSTSSFFFQTGTPIFFVLFPGVDPTQWVEDLGAEKGKTILNGLFANISMGEGQEEPARLKMNELGIKGGWVMLQNV